MRRLRNVVRRLPPCARCARARKVRASRRRKRKGRAFAFERWIPRSAALWSDDLELRSRPGPPRTQGACKKKRAPRPPFSLPPLPRSGRKLLIKARVLAAWKRMRMSQHAENNAGEAQWVAQAETCLGTPCYLPWQSEREVKEEGRFSVLGIHILSYEAFPIP